MTVVAAKRKKKTQAPVQKELNFKNLGSEFSDPLPPSQQGSKNQREVLSDWDHAS